MQILIKKLQGGECILEVLPTMRISEIKREVARKLGIPIDQQKLLLLGRTLLDEQTVESYPNIKDGTKLNLVVKKPEGLHEASMKYFKQIGMTDSEAASAATRLLKIVEEKFYKLSWDEVDRLCLECLLDERGEKLPPVESEADCDDGFNL